MPRRRVRAHAGRVKSQHTSSTLKLRPGVDSQSFHLRLATRFLCYFLLSFVSSSGLSVGWGCEGTDRHGIPDLQRDFTILHHMKALQCIQKCSRDRMYHHHRVFDLSFIWLDEGARPTNAKPITFVSPASYP